MVAARAGGAACGSGNGSAEASGSAAMAVRNSFSNSWEADWKPLRVRPRVLPSSGRRRGPNTSSPIAAITASSGKPIPKKFMKEEAGRTQPMPFQLTVMPSSSSDLL